MSETDDKVIEEGSEETREQADSGNAGDEEQSKGLPTLFFFIGFIISLVVGWVVFPAILYSSKKQPVDFNHVIHMELVDNGCESCHFFREDGTFSGAPRLAQCVDCHEDIQTESENEKVFVETYVSNGIEVPWYIYAKQPDCVFFSHAAHVKLANMDCVTCHGHIGESTSLREYEENVLTGYSRDIWGAKLWNMLTLKKEPWERMKMDDCAECHLEKTGRKTSIQTQKDGCLVCHK